MKTRMPISTISYNTRSFLVGILSELRNNGNIEEWFCIYHLAEEDEEKDHWHVFIIPNGQIDTCELKKQFVELDPSHPDLPLGCIRFEKSKQDDAALYFIHYKPYLAWKHQSRKYHYKYEDILCSDWDWIHEVFNHALHFSEFAERSAILTAIQNSQNNLVDLITTGVIPLAQACHVNAYRNMLYNDGELDRNGRVTHTPK